MSTTPIFNPGSSAANTITGNLLVTGNETVDGNLTVNGSETVRGNLFVSGTITSSGGGGAGNFGSLSVTGNSQLGTIGSAAQTRTSHNLVDDGTGGANFVSATIGTLGVTGNTQLGTPGGTNTVNTSKTVLDDGTGSSHFTGNVEIDGHLINSTAAAITLPTTAGQLALVSQIPSTTGFVTTTTLNNNTLPASLTTLTTSGNSSIGGNENVTGTITSNTSVNVNNANTASTVALANFNGPNTNANNQATSILATRGNIGAFFNGTNSISGQNNPGVDIGTYNNGTYVVYIECYQGGVSMGYPVSAVGFSASSGNLNTTSGNITAGSGNLILKSSTLAGTTTAATLTLPTTTGTLALTSQIPTTYIHAIYGGTPGSLGNFSYQGTAGVVTYTSTGDTFTFTAVDKWKMTVYAVGSSTTSSGGSGLVNIVNAAGNTVYATTPGYFTSTGIGNTVSATCSCLFTSGVGGGMNITPTGFTPSSYIVDIQQVA